MLEARDTLKPMTATRLHGLLGLAAVITACVCATVAGASSRSFPPPGRIVYSAATPALGPDSHGLFTAAADGSGARQITTNASSWDLEPRWSPDGTQVAFTRVAPDHAYTSVWVVNADGTDAHPVSGGPGYSEFPKWSPDGRWMNAQSRRGRPLGGMDRPRPARTPKIRATPGTRCLRVRGRLALLVARPYGRETTSAGVTVHLFDISRSDEWMRLVVRLTPADVLAEDATRWASGLLSEDDLRRLRAIRRSR